MKYLIDSDWVADYLKGRPQAVELLQSLVDDELAISLLTYGEIYEGILFGRERKAHEQGFRRFLRNVEVVPFNRSIMRRFAEIRGTLRQEGRIIGDLDILIAATAIEGDQALLTRNRRHFERIPGLEIAAAI